MRPRPLILALALASAATACVGGDASSRARENSLSSLGSPILADDVSPDEPFPDARCDANRDAGTVTFSTGFDLAAAASILDVIVASESGYYDELCLDVEIVPSLTPQNYDAVAAGDAQFGSGGSFSDLVTYATETDTDLVATTIEGRTTIDTLIVRAGEAADLADLDGTTIGVKGNIPAAIDVMLRRAGLTEGIQYRTVQVDGLDPVDHLAIGEIVGVPGWKSNEIGVLERAGVGVTEFDPLDLGVPGSFGVIFTSAEFVDEHPTAAQDFVRATLRGLVDAVADPDAAAQIAVDMIVERDNPQGLSIDGEVFRWETESELILDGTPEGLGLGIPDEEVLQAELDAYGELGIFDDPRPEAADFLATTLLADLYGPDEQLVWPG